MNLFEALQLTFAFVGLVAGAVKGYAYAGIVGCVVGAIAGVVGGWLAYCVLIGVPILFAILIGWFLGKCQSVISRGNHR